MVNSGKSWLRPCYFGVPDSPGVPQGVAENTPLPYNDFLMRSASYLTRSAIHCAIIGEPVGNMGCVLPEPGFLETLREVTAHGAVLIFDEVKCGFRASRKRYNINPTHMPPGKIVGGIRHLLYSVPL